MNKILIVGIAILSFIAIAGSIMFSPARDDSQGKMRVAASFYPLAEVARQVGRGNVSVTIIVPPGTEPHDYTPTPRERVGLQRVSVFVYNGAGLEPWVERIVPDLRGVVSVNASEGIALLPAIPGAEEAEESVSLYDPHFWLDPVAMWRITDLVAQAFSKADPENALYYQSNAKAYQAQLADADTRFRDGLSDCRRRDIVTSHAAFAYLAERYGLRQIPIAGIAEEEPSPSRLAEVVRMAREGDIQYIFFETLVSSRLSETIAREIGAQTLSLHTIEGLTREEEGTGENYITLMEKNLTNLMIALECL